MAIINRRPVTTYISSQYAGLPLNSVFISYRRDSAGTVAANLRFIIKTRLGDHVLFRDIESIPPGDEFRHTITYAINKCRVFLLLIDPSWCSDTSRKRLEDKNDYIRFELKLALAKRPSIRIIPILIHGVSSLRDVKLPADVKCLLNLQSVEIGEGEHYDSSIERIIRRITVPV
jgi:hypothetical protein